MTGIFKANNPYNNFLLFVYGFILKLPVFIYPVVAMPQASDGVLYTGLLGFLYKAGSSFPFLYSLIAFVFLYANAISFNRLVNNQRLLPKSNYLPGMSYLLISSLFPAWSALSAPLIISSILIWVLFQLNKLYNNPSAKSIIFNIGLGTGIATLFYLPSIAFVILIIVGLTITRPFRLPEWIIAVLGFFTSYYFLGAYLFLTDKWQQFEFPIPGLSIPLLKSSPWSVAAIVLVVFTLLVGITFVQSNIRRLVVHSRKSWSLIYLYLLVALIVPFLNSEHRVENWILALVPLAAFAAAAFLFPQRRWFSILIHWGLVILIVINGYFIK